MVKITVYLNNPNFNYGEFAIIKSQAGLNSYKISVKEWTEKTGAIGLRATAGRYGGTYAHKDIAIENLNAEYIREGKPQSERLLRLNESAIVQMKSLLGNPTIKKLEQR